MSQPTDISHALSILFAEELNVIVPSPDTDLMSEGLIDSASFVELLLLLENRFGVTIPLEELDFDNLRTLRSIGEFVGARTEGQGCRLS